MDNRFFDIDNNIYLNGLYIVVIFMGKQKKYKFNELNLKLFLLKNPYVFFNVCKKMNIVVDKSIFLEFQYKNLQADMSKYILNVHNEGFISTIKFLYSKGLVEVDFNKGIIEITDKSKLLDITDVTDNLIKEAQSINSVFEKVGIKKIENALFEEGER